MPDDYLAFDENNDIKLSNIPKGIGFVSFEFVNLLILNELDGLILTNSKLSSIY
jgi:hypothetical protein